MIPTTQLEFKTAGRKRQHWMISKAQYATLLCEEVYLSNPNLTIISNPVFVCHSLLYATFEGIWC